MSSAPASGVEVGTEQVWSYCDDSKLPRIVLINRMDRENVDFIKVVDQIQSKFGRKCLPIQLPIGAHTTFQGVIDLLKMKSYTGTAAKEGDISCGAAESSTISAGKAGGIYCRNGRQPPGEIPGGEELNQEELIKALRKAVVDGKLVPIMAGSGLQNIGIIPLMDAIVGYLPAPKEREVLIIGEGNKPAKIAPTLRALLPPWYSRPALTPMSANSLISGCIVAAITSNSQVWNVTRSENERIGQLFVLRGKNQEPVQEIAAGDIGAVAKLSVTATGDTLGAKDKPVKLVPVTFPEPRYSEAVYPKTKLDLDKLGASLAKIVEEDPTLKMHREATTSETILSGIGEIQLSVAAEKMSRKFGVNVELQTPKVPYKETITVQCEAEYKHKKQTGGHGQYGHVVLELAPLPRGSGTEFTERIVGGSIPKNFIPAVEKGVHEGVQEGVLGGYPVEDVRITAIDGSFHPVDSSEICFKIAGAGAVKKGWQMGNLLSLSRL